MIEPGKLIVLEGVDGSGTTTQVANVAQRLRQLNMNVYETAQPSSLTTGKMIRQLLQGQSLNDEGAMMQGAAMALLFAADRQAQQDVEIGPRRKAGVEVICDRYVYSSVIYQSMQMDDVGVQDWIKEINRFIEIPDITFYLQIDAQTAEDRRKARDGDAEEIFDKRTFQDRLISQYDNMTQIFPAHQIVTIDGRQGPTEITDAIMTVLNEKGICK